MSLKNDTVRSTAARSLRLIDFISTCKRRANSSLPLYSLLEGEKIFHEYHIETNLIILLNFPNETTESLVNIVPSFR